MTLLQAVLLGIFGWLTNSRTIFPLGGWYTWGRPLLSSVIIGVIMGDLTTAIMIGAAVQAVYIGLVTPGGGWFPDMTFATWIAIPICVAANQTPEFALALATPIGVITSFGVTLLETCLLVWVHRLDNQVEKMDFKGIDRTFLFASSFNFILRFVPIFAACYFGSDLLISLQNVIPTWLTPLLQVFGGLMPVVGFSILLKMMLKDWFQLVYVLLGFVLITVFKVDITTVLIVACVFAYVEFRGSANKEGGVL